MKIRGNGLLLHITSLPSPFPVGDLGPGAYRFADFLAASGQSYWQTLPLNPTNTYIGNSPYSSCSAFAGNPLLISPELLVADGYLNDSDLYGAPQGKADRVDYESADALKTGLLRLAFARNQDRIHADAGFRRFQSDNRDWLDDYALFTAIKTRFNGAIWNEWPSELRDRRPDALAWVRGEMAAECLFEAFRQYVFHKQWESLRLYCNRKCIRIIGDMPIYTTYDSADVWSRPDLYKLDQDKRPTAVAGVPPDYFSRTGQLWGNPVYDWSAHQRQGFGWWIARMEHNIRLYDFIRLDHFRGFAAYWEVPAGDRTAEFGKWVDAPGQDLFRSLYVRFPILPIIAEDLGHITPDVRELKSTHGFPGMKILQFAFGHDLPRNPDAPHNYDVNNIVYTGTHDNNTIRGWFEAEAGDDVKGRLTAYLGKTPTPDSISWDMIRLAMSSVACRSIIPMQDVLNLGADSRMNTPAIPKGNWEWRLPGYRLNEELSWRLRDLSRLFGRTA